MAGKRAMNHSANARAVDEYSDDPDRREEELAADGKCIGSWRKPSRRIVVAAQFLPDSGERFEVADGVCPVCGKRFRLKADGTLILHRAPSSSRAAA